MSIADYELEHKNYVAVSTTLDREGRVQLVARQFKVEQGETRGPFRVRVEVALLNEFSPLGRDIMLLPVVPGQPIISGIGSDDLNKALQG